jgi:hypothetical protein
MRRTKRCHCNRRIRRGSRRGRFLEESHLPSLPHLKETVAVRTRLHLQHPAVYRSWFSTRRIEFFGWFGCNGKIVVSCQSILSWFPACAKRQIMPIAFYPHAMVSKPLMELEARATLRIRGSTRFLLAGIFGSRSGWITGTTKLFTISVVVFVGLR